MSETPQAPTDVPSSPVRSRTWWPMPAWAQIAGLALVLAVGSGAIGAALVLWLHPDPPAPLRVAVIDIGRVSRAFTESAGREPRGAAAFPEHFDRAVRQLQTAEPTRLLLLKEAVVGTDSEDLTDALLTLLRTNSAARAPARPGASRP
jgi:hypothetical protein